MNTPGVDYAFPPRPEIASLVAAGFKFACRYGGPGTRDKQLDPQEAQDLAAAGISVVANAEGSATGLGNGWATGVAWARSAELVFAACGMPPGRPIYFSADFDVTIEDWPAVADALQGAASVIGAPRVGVYGGYNVMRWAARDGVAKWFWQTYAWSAGRWAPGNHIEQYRNGVTIGGADCDLNRALQADYGQWMPGISPTKETEMLLYKIKGQDAIYEQRGGYRHHIGPDLFGTLSAQKAFTLIEVGDEAELLDAVGPEKPTVEDIDVAALAEALKAYVDEAIDTALTAQAAAYRAAADSLDTAP